MLESPILYLKGMRAIMFQLSGFYYSTLGIVNQNVYYRILTIKLVNQKKELPWRL